MTRPRLSRLLRAAFAGCLLASGSAVGAQPLEITLQQGLAMALEKNERLQIARGELDRAGYQVGEALADGLPRVDATAVYNRNWRLPSTTFQGQTVHIGSRNNITSAAVLRQTVFGGGRILSGLRAAGHFRELSREAFRQAGQEIHAAVETAFYDLLLARDLVRVSDLALERARRNLREVQLLRQAGRASRFDVLRAEVQVLELHPDSIRARRDLAVADLTLKNAIGLDPEQPIVPIGGFRAEPPAGFAVPDSLVGLGLRHRPDLRQARHLVEAQHQNVRVEVAGRLPTLDLVVNGQVQILSDDLDFQNDARKSWYSGLSLSVPLFDGLRTRALIAQARVDLRRARLEAGSLERRIRLEVRRAWLDYRESDDRQKTQERTLTLTREGLRAAQAQYAEGVGTQLEVADAQLSLLRAETEVARAQRDRSVALVRLEFSLGLLGEPAAWP